MRLRPFVNNAAAVSAVAALSGCGGFQTPVASFERPAQSWVQPNGIRQKDLIYVTSVPFIDIFAYPDGKAMAQIRGAYPYGLCVNRAGDVYVVDPTQASITEYAHGAMKPKATLSYPDYNPTQCAVDPATGNLAVISGSGAAVRRGSQYLNVWIYAHGKGAPAQYQLVGLNYLYFPAYDDKSNLFIDGIAPYNGFGLAELANGQNTFRIIRLDQEIQNRIRSAGGIQWCAGRLAVANNTRYGHGTIDRLRIGGARAYWGNQTVLSGAGGIGSFWIEDGAVTAPQETAAYLWPYPKGGQSIALFAASGGNGVVVSPARK
jgi:hypothetical protein